MRDFNIEQDIEWIISALTDPTYLMMKHDNTNMFELNSDDEYYIREVIEELEIRGYKVNRVGYYISVE